MEPVTIRVKRFDFVVKPYEISVESLKKLYEKMSKYPVIFGKKLNGVEDFVKIFITYSIPSGDPWVNGLFYSVNDLEVGVLYLTNIMGVEADAHFSFFDGNLKGREQIIRVMSQKVMDEFGFRRLNITIPRYANKKVNAFVERCGAVYEGEKFASAPWEGKWFNEARYVIINKKLLNVAA